MFNFEPDLDLHFCNWFIKHFHILNIKLRSVQFRISNLFHMKNPLIISLLRIRVQTEQNYNGSDYSAQWNGKHEQH